MTTLRDLRKAPRATAREAIVASPALAGDGMLRVVPDAHPGGVVAVPWMPRPTEQPSPGDAALIVESDGGSWWCVAWWPQ